MQGNRMYTKRLSDLNNQFDRQIMPLYKDITNLVLPRRGFFPGEGDPSQIDVRARHDQIIDDAGTKALRTLGAGLQGGLCSPSRPWFRRSMKDPDLSKYGPVKAWLRTVEEAEYSMYRGTNFYNVVHTAFEELGGFGTAPILQMEDPNTVMRFRISTAGEYRIALGEDGTVDTIYRDLWLTAFQLQAMFGRERLSAPVQSAIENNPYSYFRVIHVVEPRSSRDPNMKDHTNMAFRSLWFEYGENDTQLRDSGFEEFPGAVPRWAAIANLAYGLAPGHSALGNIKMLQEMQKSAIKGVHKKVDPPMKVPSKYKGLLNLTPGATNVVDDDGAGVGSLYDVNLSIQELEYKIMEIKKDIDATFYADLFLMLSRANDRSDMTATEVVERHEEKLLMLGPTVERQETELLQPILGRGFNIMWRAGLIPEPPKEIQGQEMKIEFVSLLAQAQKLVTSQSLHAYLGMAERVQQVSPLSVHKTDYDEFLEQFGDVVGLPPKIVKSKEDTEKSRAAEAQAIAQQKKLEQMQMAAGAAKDLSGVQGESSESLNALKGSMSG